MARKRKVEESPPLVDNLKESYEVQKSTPLFSLWRSDITLAEFKILDTYLARIDSYKPERRSVRFEKGELENLFGVKQIKAPELKERLKHLMGHVVELKDPRKKKGFALITLFSMAECDKDENGLWQVDLACTQEAMDYFFNIEELGYLRYKLRSVLSISSRYSYVLFTYLESNRFRKTWEISLKELREVLNCADDELYNEYKRLNERILKRSQKELHEKTACRFTYEPIKKGRTVVAIRFTLETLEDILPPIPAPKMIPGQMNFDELDGSAPSNPFDETIAFLSGACDEEFSKAQMESIFAIISTKKLPEHPDGVNFARYHYLAKMYAKLKVKAEQQDIPYRYNYFEKMLENDD